MRRPAASLVVMAVALLGATPAASPPASAPRTLTVVCRAAHLYAFVAGSDRPNRAAQHDVTMGQRFALVSGPRETLDGYAYYETDIPVVEPGLRGHYWLSSACAVPA